MYSLLLFTIIVAVLLQPVSASSPFVDFTVADTPLDAYPDIDNVLCELCCLPFYQCIHARMPQFPAVATRAFYNDPNFFRMPPLDFDQTQSDLALIYEYVNAGPVQPLISEHVRVMDVNETTVQPATVQAHVEDTYNPGDRLPAQRNRRAAPRRQAPRPGGFVCDEDGCGKTFNRQCDLNRHQKKHSTNPHVCLTCNRRFLYPKDLRRHLPQHNDSSLSIDKYHCSHPGCHNLDGFSRRDNLLRHQRRQHPEN